MGAMARRAQSHPDRPQVRISSTLFHHLSPSYQLRPLKGLRGATAESEAAAERKYEPMTVGRFVEIELRGIALALM